MKTAPSSSSTPENKIINTRRAIKIYHKHNEQDGRRMDGRNDAEGVERIQLRHTGIQLPMNM